MPNDLVQLSTDGYLITPPDTRGNIQRIFVPKIGLGRNERSGRDRPSRVPPQSR